MCVHKPRPTRHRAAVDVPARVLVINASPEWRTMVAAATATAAAATVVLCLCVLSGVVVVISTVWSCVPVSVCINNLCAYARAPPAHILPDASARLTKLVCVCVCVRKCVCKRASTRARAGGMCQQICILYAHSRGGPRSARHQPPHQHYTAIGKQAAKHTKNVSTLLHGLFESRKTFIFIAK